MSHRSQHDDQETNDWFDPSDMEGMFHTSYQRQDQDGKIPIFIL